MGRTRYRADELGARPFGELPAAALRAVLREGYRAADLRRDVMAGLVVGVVALPLSMALAIGVGAPPQQGLYTAIVGGILTAALGGSRTQVTGPTAAFIVILAPIMARFGLPGLLTAGLMAGLILIALGLFRLGRLIQFIPYPVTTGFTAGIATVIATLQIKDVLGLTLSGNPEFFVDRLVAMVAARHTASVSDFAIGAFTLTLLLGLPRTRLRVPAPLVALPLAALGGVLFAHLAPDHAVATVGSRFHTVIDGITIRGIPRLPPLPMWPWSGGSTPGGAHFHLDLTTLRALAPGAFAIAMLGAIESLLSAVVADGMARTRHDPDAELLALGVANLVTPFFGGIPATGAIARTATNIRSGARSPVAAMVHSLTILLAMLLLAPLVAFLPMAALAALLLLVARNMAEVRHFVHIVRVSPRADAAVLLTCFGLTVLFDMVVAVSVGVVLAALLFMQRMAELTHVRALEGPHPDLPHAVPPGVVVYDIAGPLFFGAAEKAVGAIRAVGNDVRAVVIRLDAVPTMDATGLVALESAIERMRAEHVFVALTGLREQPAALLAGAGIKDRPGILIVCPALPEAFAAAADFARSEPVRRVTGRRGAVTSPPAS